MKTTYLIVSIIIGILFAPTYALALCGGPLSGNAFKRPIDYNDPNEKQHVNLVERYHFTPEVAALVSGKSSDVPNDLDYTLRQIPNHYRALDAMARWQLINPYQENPGYWSVECYFERAFHFTPNDPTLYIIQGVYLHKKKKFDDALASYQRAVVLGSRSAELHYNLGLLYVEKKQYKKALDQAKKAYSLGYTLPALKNKLQKLGHWK